ncbi:hypothetical protein ACI2KR_26945 [Pseudomonas luteola]
MKGFSRFAVLALMALAVTACSTVGRNVPQFTDAQPTPETVNEYGVIYKGSFITQKDFLADGSLKTLNDYDFTKESAPCTAIDPKLEKVGGESVAYKVTRKGNEYIFICRGMTSIDKNERRLFLAGTKYECLSRYESYIRSPNPGLEKASRLCGGMTKSSDLSRTEKNYLDLLKASKG